MLFYQALIMAVVVILIYTLAYFLKSRHRKILVTCIVALIVAGGIGLYSVQYYFGNHYYEQELSTAALAGVNPTKEQIKNIHEIFSDYTQVNDDDGSVQAAAPLAKKYTIDKNGVHSVIDSSIYVFSNAKDADKYFEANQKFYENKTYIPLDSQKSKRTGSGERYLVSFIRSQYRNYTDFIYLPSKITYSSDVMIVHENVVFIISETANRPATNKAEVLSDIKEKLNVS